MKINIEFDQTHDNPDEIAAVGLALCSLADRLEKTQRAARSQEFRERWKTAVEGMKEKQEAIAPAFTTNPTNPTEPITVKRGRPAKAASPAPAAPEQQTELPVEEPAPAPAEPAPAPAAAPATAVPDFAAVKAAAVDLVNKHGGEIQSALTKFISVQFKDADGNPARLFTLTDDGRAKTMATVQACAALADKDAILKHLAV